MPHTHLHHLHGTRAPANAPRHFYSPVPAIDLPHRDGHFLPPVPAVGMTHSTMPHAPAYLPDPVIMPPPILLPSSNPSETPSLESGHVGTYPHLSNPLPTPSAARSPPFSNAGGTDFIALFIAALVVLSAIGAVLWWMSWLMKRKDRRIMLEEEEEREEKEGWMRGMMSRGVRGKDAERGEEEGGLFWLLGGSRECK